MEISFAHLCDYATISREGKLSAMGIFSRINAASFPYAHPQAFLAFEILLNWAEVGKEFPIRVDLVDADGTSVFRAEARLTAHGTAKPGERPRIPQVLGIGGMKFERGGTYVINFWLDDKLERQLEFAVEKAQRPDVSEQG